jgi:hypothetical protein
MMKIFSSPLISVGYFYAMLRLLAEFAVTFSDTGADGADY